ncbi:MAG: site-2 protease family protein [Phycisphaerales bacterium]|nr:site-2 protease family protein [Phycisphaerales bacterium]
MEQALSGLGTLADFGLVVIGFSLIIFVHELGHFLAARWAGIRVLAFAIGFGPALLSYRKGLGPRRGSSEDEYQERKREGSGRAGDSSAPTPQSPNTRLGISPTEYRLNWLPLGGYVKMLGQDDMDPSARSAEPDSYQSVAVWKRMIVISAGVVMNIVVAAVLFVAVFMHGLRVEPAKVGSVQPGSPAAMAVAENAAQAGVTRPGLAPGDEVLKVDGRKPNSFGDVMIAGAMAPRDGSVSLVVQRAGVREPLRFDVKPRPARGSGLLEMGLSPPYSARIDKAANKADAAAFRKVMASVGAAGLEPGMTLVRVGDDRTITGGWDLVRAVRESGGHDVEAEFAGEDGRHVVITLHPEPMLQADNVPQDQPGEFFQLDHLLGLTPVMRVEPDAAGMNARGAQQGLREGDVFVRLGDTEYPSGAEGVREIKRNIGGDLRATVRRDGHDVDLTLRVGREGGGTVGFRRGDTRDESTLIARPPARIEEARDGAADRASAASSLNLRPGSRIVSIDGVAVANFGEMRAALVEAAKKAEGERTTIRLVVQPPVAGAAPEPMDWTLATSDLRRVLDLKWTHPLVAEAFPFAAEEATLKAATPVEAVKMGVAETRRVMITTYITFARLFEGTVKVEHLKGPVGIAHLGTRIASRGVVWLLFFMALISVNLAVVNFLPLPIVDGGQFVFLLVEQVRGKPVSVAVQNAANAAGLLLIGAIFLVVTFNDVANLF